MKIHVDHVTYYASVKGEGEPVILLHGFTGDHTTWKSLFPYLTHSFQVIAVDLVGHGRTDAPDDCKWYDMSEVASQIIKLMDKLNIEQAHLLGYSMGGRLAISIAMLYPNRVKSLLLESTSPGIKTAKGREERIQQDELLAEKILTEGIKKFVYYWEQISLFSTQAYLPENIRQQIRSQRLKNSEIGLANSLKGMGTGRQPSWWDRLHEIKQPTLLMCGELDEKFCHIADEMKELLPYAHLEKVKGVGHTIHVEEPSKFGTIVRDFLYNRRTNNN